ncbi:SDR family oxidoreductase [Thalassospira povalilytica]|uniref:SDR family oxidoreductase n=1 Tax=Thalassospira povalilytica TaxID=732237 RepID=A0A8I1MBA8_9PROT|nr:MULTISPECIES: SDR family oxidoreductase [Thalassospira]KZB69398.1 oxidoreductase [Thalassospira sp. MCCC 1A02491]MBN8198124.1 SDR family oxidoreductase [Thalassospira povalilytica]MCC4239087.1 SDR family oxidoreductase [Thalassospira povalilytica]RCK19117.1 oxidoreductase [Thalassospira profundimaris]
MTNPINYLENKTVIITGASSGIGEATARLLASRGAKVVLGARRTERLDQIVTEIEAAGGTAMARSVDVTNADSVEALVYNAQNLFGRVDAIFNNAGVMPLAPMSELKTDEWENMINVNIRGVLNGIAAVLPIFKAQGGGHVINTASIGAHVVVPSAAVYCGTKYAVWAISEGLRQESENVRVTTISPGVVETELGHDISDPTSKELLTQFRQIALTPDAIARAVLYALDQPADVDVNEVIVRPTASAF